MNDINNAIENESLKIASNVSRKLLNKTKEKQMIERKDWTIEIYGIELAKYALELCACQKGYDMAGLKKMAEEAIEKARKE